MVRSVKLTVDTPRPDSFFSLVFKRKLVIPPYQRFYTWDKDLITQFIEDLDLSLRANRKMYLGTIIVKPTGDGLWRIIDGQQRILTIVIFLRALRNSNKLSNTNNKLIDDWFEGTTIIRVEIDLNEKKRNDFFNSLILQGKKIDLSAYKNHKYAEKINLCFETVSKHVGGKTAHQANTLFDFLRDHIEMIAIQLDQDSDESDVFESINSKRMELTSSDLIKNFLLSKAVGKKAENLAKKWDEFCAELEDESHLQKFFENYCDAYSQKDPVKIKDTYKRFRQIYKKYHKNDPIRSLNDLRKFAKYYTQLKNGIGRRTKVSKEVSASLESINYLKFSSQTPLLMKILGLGVGIEDKQFLKILMSVELIQFLYQEIEGVLPQVVKDYLFSQMWSMRKKKDAQKIITALESKKKELLTPDNKTQISELAIEGNKKRRTVNYILYRVFRSNSSSIVNVSLNTSDSSLEHIFPQTKDPQMSSLNDDWKKILREDLAHDKDLAAKMIGIKERQDKVSFYHSRVVQSLGNLTLLSIPENSSIGDMPFLDKRKKYTQTERKNVLFDFVLKQSKWNAAAIRNNSLNLMKRYLSVF